MSNPIHNGEIVSKFTIFDGVESHFFGARKCLRTSAFPLVQARQPTEPFAPDVDGLFVAAGTRSEALAAGDARGSPSESPGQMVGMWGK